MCKHRCALRIVVLGHVLNIWDVIIYLWNSKYVCIHLYIVTSRMWLIKNKCFNICRCVSLERNYVERQKICLRENFWFIHFIGLERFDIIKKKKKLPLKGLPLPWSRGVIQTTALWPRNSKFSLLRDVAVMLCLSRKVVSAYQKVGGWWPNSS